VSPTEGHVIYVDSEASAETLSVSSLRGSELRQTLEQTMEKLTRK